MIVVHIRHTGTADTVIWTFSKNPDFGLLVNLLNIQARLNLEGLTDTNNHAGKCLRQTKKLW